MKFERVKGDSNTKQLRALSDSTEYITVYISVGIPKDIGPDDYDTAMIPVRQISEDHGQEQGYARVGGDVYRTKKASSEQKCSPGWTLDGEVKVNIASRRDVKTQPKGGASPAKGSRKGSVGASKVSSLMLGESGMEASVGDSIEVLQDIPNKKTGGMYCAGMRGTIVKIGPTRDTCITFDDDPGSKTWVKRRNLSWIRVMTPQSDEHLSHCETHIDTMEECLSSTLKPKRKLAVGDFVEVASAFENDGGHELITGNTGKIVAIDNEVDTKIQFGHLRKPTWVLQHNLGRLRKQCNTMWNTCKSTVEKGYGMWCQHG